MKLNYCLLFSYYIFSVYTFLIIYLLLLWYIKGAGILNLLLSVLIYLIKLNLMKFQVCYNFISFFTILPHIYEHPQKLDLNKKKYSWWVCLINSYKERQNSYDFKTVNTRQKGHKFLFNFGWYTIQLDIVC